METSSYVDVLRGRYKEVPNVRSKVVRIFVSSTFTDTLTERDSLIENIFPKLKDYCREKYGLEFQYADMRWGIQTESVNNHSEVATCLKEIELCKKYSVATNFVVLLSHRYGSRPIPSEIPATLFDILKQTVFDKYNENNDYQLLTQWYQLDTNSIPHTYILQNISSIIPNFISKNTDEVKQADKEWKKINNRLRICLRQAAKTCLEQNQISKNDYDEFFISVTEKEIINGILSASDANERTLCFFREIIDIHNHLSDDKASKYIDMLSKTDIDHEAEELLNHLKNTRIPSVLKNQNIFKYKIHWSSKGINRQDHSDYIEQFNKDFYISMKEQIDRCVQGRFTISSDSLQHEVLEQAIQCKTYVEKFHGRSDVLSELEKYVKNEKEHRPCVVHGDSGCGKTSVLAKTATEIFKWWSNRSVSVILRFLGTTPSSSNIYKTLLSISEHISELYNIPMTTYSTVYQLRDQLELNLLSQIPDNEYLLILLDSIDQLSSDAYNCKWLPRQFPSNIKCILSTLSDHENILENLTYILNEDKNLFIHIPPFEASTVEIVYKNWLKMKNRSLSDDQYLFINNLMKKKKEILPLFMKLVFDIISILHSYDIIDEHLNELNDVDDCIRYLFHHLEIIHNQVLFSRALCYMTACQNGICQNELEDILSLDDDVLKSIFQHYIPPVRRLPGILWTRIRNDLDEYITEKEIDDAPVIYWYHRRFIEVAEELYILKLNETDRRKLFQNIVDLFKETWKGKNKPFKIDNPKLVQKYNLDKSNGEIQANRFITSQPTEFIDINGKIQYNKRKLNELPQFLNIVPSNIAAEEMIFNYSFMHAKFSCSSFVEIQTYLERFGNESSHTTSNDLEIENETSILCMTYLLFSFLLNEYPDNYAFELTSRLLPLYGLKPYITNLLKQCDEQCPKHCALIVPYAQMQPPGNGLIFSINKHTMPVVHLDFGKREMISLSNKIVITRLGIQNVSMDINLPKINEPYLNFITIPKMNIYSDNEQYKNLHIDVIYSSDSDSDFDYDENEEKIFKNYGFLVNSYHYVYLVSMHSDIKFHQYSEKGYLTVEVINFTYGLCILVEQNSNSIQCWNLIKNKLFAKLDLSINVTIKTVLSTKLQTLVIIIVLNDGTILFYTLNDSIFIHRATINAGKHLDIVIVNNDKLICTFDLTIPIDIAYINLNLISQTEQVLIDKDIVKTLIAFDPPINPKPIQRIVLPDKKITGYNDLMQTFFMILTKECLYIVHNCMKKDISYVRIPGQFDVISAHAHRPHSIFTARGGIVNMYKWQCIKGENGKCDIYHEYQLFISIDISSSSVLTVKPSDESGGGFICSMQTGLINAYLSRAARKAFKKIPPFPRTTELIDTIKLSETKAVTLDISKQELTVWLYQYSTSIESKLLFSNSTKIDDYALLSDIAVLIITNSYWAEVYSLKSLNKEPIFRLHLHYPTKVFIIDNNYFILITNDGSIRCITSQINENNLKFNQTSNTQLNIKCTKLFSSILTLNSKQSLIILDDNQQSLSIWTNNNIIYMNIDLSQYSLNNHLLKITSEIDEEIILFYFENKNLLSCKIKLSNKNSTYELTSYDKVDMYSLKNNYLATVIHDYNQLNLRNISSSICHESIQLENKCEQLCFNQTGNYLFSLVKPRILLMFRINDRRRLARLFVYDFVTTMIANNDFIILAMNDRRLLTLIIADPDDKTLQKKISNLPSRNLQQDNNSVGKSLVEQLDNYQEDTNNYFGNSDSEIESDDEMDDTQINIHERKKDIKPITSYRYVHYLNKKLPLTKMKTDDSYRIYFLKNYAGISKLPITSDIVINDSDDDDNDIVSETQYSIVNSSTEQKHNLDDIHEKTIEYDRQQIKGIQLANAGTNNLRIINNYSVTSSTCIIM